MEVYSTEEQQEEAIKKAIKDNWLIVLVGAAIGLASVYGWRTYSANQLEQRGMASDAYNQVVEQAGKDDADVVALAKEYIDSHDNKSYTVMIALLAAKEAVAKKDMAEAVKQLQWAADNAQNDSLKAVCLTRLARVQIELQQYTEALATLSKPMPASFIAQIEELKGDVFLKQGDVEKARTAYQLAADNDGTQGNNGLQYKLDDLAQATPGV
jgi:predicted negative regulator of RcsB-dependent stress response